MIPAQAVEVPEMPIGDAHKEMTEGVETQSVYPLPEAPEGSGGHLLLNRNHHRIR